MSLVDLRRLLPRLDVEVLANGLTVAVLNAPRRPVVATALVYRAGARDDAPGHGGTAHYLEHMMFKGSQNYAAGEIDRTTMALGGSNNAFTSHDLTLYYFTFAADRWHRALAIEGDRMAGLLLEEDEVRSERQVILEEIAMYESEPWDVLDHNVSKSFYGAHPYGRPILGSRDELRATGAQELAAFHQRYYRPENAILVLAGAVGDDAVARAADSFAALERNGGPPQRAVAPEAEPPAPVHRLERRAGELARFLFSMPAPAATDPEHAPLRLLLNVLGSGRASRLHRALVDEGQLCVGVSADLTEGLDPGSVSFALEVLPGIEAARVEEALFAELEKLRTTPPDIAEVERAKKILIADWTFDHEKVYQQAFLTATSMALFDAEHPWRYLETLLTTTPADLPPLIERYLQPRRGVLGWSLPATQEP